MGVSLRVVEWLRSTHHDVRHLREEGLHRLPDADILVKAAREERVVLTFDLDFGELLALSGERTVSVILFRLRNTRTPNVIDRLTTVLRLCGAVLERGAIVVVEDGRHRVRHLPLRS
jgi:predicted nuclease of predicted toxin-antitoxin system